MRYRFRALETKIPSSKPLYGCNCSRPLDDSYCFSKSYHLQLFCERDFWKPKKVCPRKKMQLRFRSLQRKLSKNVVPLRKLRFAINKVQIQGDCAIRYYEVNNEFPFVHYINTYTTSEPQRGIGFMPKLGINSNENEVARVYKVTTKGIVDILQFFVPRKSDLFQVMLLLALFASVYLFRHLIFLLLHLLLLLQVRI